jgi:hypothetical protein
MLKIRITGSESELRQVASQAGANRIRRVKRQNGKTIFALDLHISAQDFLNSYNPNSKSSSQPTVEDSIEVSDIQKGYNPQDIQAELEELLYEITVR